MIVALWGRRKCIMGEGGRYKVWHYLRGSKKVRDFMLVKAYERILEVGKASHCLLDILLVRGLEYDFA